MDIGNQLKQLIHHRSAASTDSLPATDWKLRLARSKWRIEGLVLIIGVLLSLWLAAVVEREDRLGAQQVFDRAVQRSKSELLARFMLPVHGLNGLKGSFADTEPLTRAQFGRYIASRDLSNEFPGMAGIAFEQRVQRRDLDQFIARTRADQAADFAIRTFSNSQHDDLYVVTYLATVEQNTQPGWDLGSDPVRRRAIEQAIYSGQPSMTEGIYLMIDSAPKSPSVLINVPVYAKAATLDTPAQRRAALVGVLTAPTVISSLLDARGDIGQDTLQIRLLGPIATTGSTGLWYDNQGETTTRPATTKPLYQDRIEFNLYDQRLELQIASTPAFEKRHLGSTHLWVLMTGLLLSAAVALALSRHLGSLRRTDIELSGYRHLAGQAHSAYLATDATGRITQVSSGFEQLTGYSKSEVLGKHPISLLYCEQTDLRQIICIREALRTNGYYVGEILNRSKQGRFYWVELHIQPSFDHRGERIGLIVSSVDVTIRRQSQTQLEEAEQRNRNLLEALNHNAIVSITSLDGVIQQVNNGFCRISGYSEAELVGQPHNIINAGADNVVNWRQVWQTISAGKVWHGEVCNRAKDGSLYWVDTAIVPFFSATGKINSYVSVRFDITQLKRAQARAEQQTALLEGAIATIGQAFCIYDTDDRLVYFNDQYRKVYAKSAEKIMVGSTFESIVRFGAENGQYLEAIGRVDEWVAERIAFHQRGDDEIVQHLDDGRILRIIERRMSTGYIVGFRIDITDMVKAKETAQAAERAKSQFLANMSHEIRTPMNAVLGMLTLLGRTALTPQQSDYVGKAERAGTSLLGLLNDILDLSKIGADMMQLEPHPFLIEQLMRGLAEIFASTLSNPDVELLLDLDPRAAVAVIGDSLRLHQILLNLGGNAIKFTQQGHVLIGVKLLERDATQLRLRFEVSDTGIGMDAEFQRVIFDAFTQAERSTSRRYGGTGLGMAITSQLVAMMDGELQVQSELGQGSRFQFEIALPLDPAAPTEASDSTRPALGEVGLRVLVVEDYSQARELLLRICSSLGWNATACDSGEAALLHLRQQTDQGQRYDVVFMDHKMTGIDGLETCKRLREWDSKTPVVLMNTFHGIASSQQNGAGLLELINGQIMKPVTASMLFDAVVNLRTQGSPATIRTEPSQLLNEAPLAGLRLLVAEDNLVNQQLARELLMSEGAEVEIAANGQIALDMLQSAANRYDIVLMDMQMPVMDGLAATRAIRTMPGLLTLPIVAMTANAMREDRQACLAAGMNDHVPKPLDMDELIEVILQQVQAVKSRAISSLPDRT